MEVYRPNKLAIKDLEGGAFKIVDEDNDGQQLATILEFNPINSDLSIEMVKEFSQFLIGYYNHNYK